jgi:hypothetical protein
MSPRAVSCTKCSAEIPPASYNTADMIPCPSCGTPIQVAVFPALFREMASRPGESILSEGEAGCFYHPDKRAVIACDTCGRFLCGLCDLELNGRHICPACLEIGRKKKSLTQLENRRVRYDSIALLLATLPILVWPFTIFTAPAAVFFAIYGWKKPKSITGGGWYVRAVLAILLGLLQIAGWVAGATFLFRSITHG